MHLALLPLLLLSVQSAPQAPSPYPYEVYVLSADYTGIDQDPLSIIGIDAAGQTHTVAGPSDRLQGISELSFDPGGQNLYALRSGQADESQLLRVGPMGDVAVVRKFPTTFRAMTIPSHGRIQFLSGYESGTFLTQVDPASGFAVTRHQIAMEDSAIRDMTFDAEGNLYYTGGPVTDIGVWRIAPNFKVEKIADDVTPGLFGGPIISSPYGIFCDTEKELLWVCEVGQSGTSHLHLYSLASERLTTFSNVGQTFDWPGLRSISGGLDRQAPVLGFYELNQVRRLKSDGTFEDPIAVSNPFDVDVRPNGR